MEMGGSNYLVDMGGGYVMDIMGGRNMEGVIWI